MFFRQLDSMYHHLGVLINLIVTQYFRNFHCVFYFIENNYDIVSQSVPAVIINTSTILEEYIAEEDRNLIDFDTYCQGFVIQAQNINLIFNYVEEFLMDANMIYKYNIRKYLFIVATEESIDEILGSPHINTVSNMLFVSSSKLVSEEIQYFDLKHHEICNLWTTSFITSNVYEKTLLDRWSSKNQSFIYKSILFPEKMPNQQGKLLNISTYSLSPYSVVGE